MGGSHVPARVLVVVVDLPSGAVFVRVNVTTQVAPLSASSEGLRGMTSIATSMAVVRRTLITAPVEN